MFIIRVFHGCDVRKGESVRGSLFGITRLCRVMPNSDPEGRSFLSVPSNYDRFFFLHTFWSPAFNFNAGIAINKWCSYTLASAVLRVGVVCDVAMTSTPNVLMTQLCDLLYNQCIDNTGCYCYFICPAGRVWVCEVGFGSNGEGRGKICMVCKKILSYIYRPGRKCCCFFCCLYFSMCKQWRLGRDSGDAQACLRLLTRSVYDINTIFLLADSIVRNWNCVVSYYTAQVILFFKHRVAILTCCSKRLNDIGAEEYKGFMFAM